MLIIALNLTVEVEQRLGRKPTGRPNEAKCNAAAVCGSVLSWRHTILPGPRPP